ncbi:hypothetical protein Poly41_68500 [Novipirellula artificiosorum]|uniref:Uncharacterized protein n=1 Tax=Novipirellula artificiosorum TaxID=2528016 RepID=A0A5C6D1W8_9BACT|nr:hypothetical protein Poly41_68500 [Novipirellula artificiosorum]
MDDQQSVSDLRTRLFRLGNLVGRETRNLFIEGALNQREITVVVQAASLCYDFTHCYLFCFAGTYGSSVPGLIGGSAASDA